MGAVALGDGEGGGLAGVVGDDDGGGGAGAVGREARQERVELGRAAEGGDADYDLCHVPAGLAGSVGV